MMHIPVLLEEAVYHLNCQPGKEIVDCTVGQGGHSRKILESIGPKGFLWGIDRDEKVLELAEKNLAGFNNYRLINGNFGNLENIAKRYFPQGIDGVLFDLGVSSLQLDEAGRGFSYQKDTPLDMRMDTGQEITARSLVNQLPLEELTRIIKEYGEESWAKRIARFIVKEREKKELKTTGELVEVIKAAVPARARRKGGHPARRTFQALRIAVNKELENLKRGLEASFQILRPGGRLCVISFHSLEDRMVKEFFKSKEGKCICPPKAPLCICGQRKEIKIINRKPVTPKKEEIEQNPRARSARLRAGEKLTS
ncbi:MAG: 16S rRNA (cytosine(1402)-N(4))-methyltransferase RsmH [Candidatus Syntrophonatronum acetioxidans]|uniref:Ribosomal RNA small subunit methyltransferase H n=2 Tax=Candidatus Syntrophonatronum acetioxidans TaxID=1795816 RepID=A0A424YAG5_9FIRM|nr:MAG: 16S rRNA (cytosine(1402)-N(4))-methyltransferase RsmH [Candidatus Syntrophonatronum acetioxidans]